MGGDIYGAVLSVKVESFNPRPRMGGDHTKLSRMEDMRGFNPRPRMGGDCFFITFY